MNRYLCAQKEIVKGSWTIVGAPLDETGSYKRGACDGPNAIREASHSLECYCPLIDRDLSDRPFADIGNMAFLPGLLEEAQDIIAKAIRDIFEFDAHPLMLGGEHTISVAAIKEAASRYDELVVVQLDAHADLRETYDSTPLSHACVMRRVLECVDSSHIFQIGIRSGTREEWQWMREHQTVHPATKDGANHIVSVIGNRPVYLTVDLDILDPSIMPGTGTPEPGGPNYSELERILKLLMSLNIVAADVVELAPSLDSSGVSAVVAAKIVRSLLASRIPADS